jgi:hypothetical protein
VSCCPNRSFDTDTQVLSCAPPVRRSTPTLGIECRHRSLQMHIFNATTDPLNFQFDYNPTETAALRSRTYEKLSIEDLRRIALWKLDRVLEVPECLLVKVRALAGNASVTARSPEAIEVLERLVQCDGVGYPMASAILKFLHPTIFSIIDVRAYRALTGKRLRPHQYTTDLYLEYVDKLKDIAATRQVNLAVVDEQLYCFDKARNGKIDA